METFNVFMIFLLTYSKGLQVSHCFDCDFDTGLCGWKQDTSDDFNWTRLSGKTSSTYTGPESDHTTTNGFYIYIETSPPRQVGDKAKLISPLKEPGSHCLIFWYSMYGKNIHTLNVYLRTDTSNDTLIFSRVENTDATEWRRDVVSVSTKVKYKVVFEGIAGEAKGDIAVDDISLKNGMCSVDCDFDSDICNWTQGSDDNFDWAKRTGGTLSPGTGPLADHTSGGGSYIYIEASYPRVYGDRANLISPVQGPGLYCLMFWYTMYGQQINCLNVFKKVDEGESTLLFSKKNGTNNVDWKEAIFNYNATSEHEIVLEGVCGGGNQGDIAVDDISMTPGPCVTGTTSTTKLSLSSQALTSEISSSFTSASMSKADKTTQTKISSVASTISSATLFSPTASRKNIPVTGSSIMTTTRQTSLITLTTLSTKNMSSAALTTNTKRTSRKPLVTNLTRFTLQTNTQEVGGTSIAITRKAVETTQLTPVTSLTTLEGVTGTHATSHSSNTNTTMNNYTNLPMESGESSTSESNVLALSTSASFSSTQTTNTITQIQNIVSERKESSLNAIYISLLAVATTLVVLVIVLFIFVCRRSRKEIIRINTDSGISTDSGSVQISDDTDLVVFNQTFIDDTLEGKTDYKFYIGNVRLRQDQYTEVSLENIQQRDTTDNEYCATASKHNIVTVSESYHTYSHIPKQRNHFLDTTYSHISEVHDNHTLSDPSDLAITKYWYGSTPRTEVNATETTSQCAEILHKAYSDTETVGQDADCCDDEIDTVYDHIVTGGKSMKTKEVDEYSRLTQMKSREKKHDHNYGYSFVSKKKSNADSVFAFSERKENNFNRNSTESQQQSERENNCSESALRDKSDYTESKEEMNHHYFVLEKVDY